LRLTHKTGLVMSKAPRGRPAARERMPRAMARLLSDVPDYISDTYPLDEFGLHDGLSLLAAYWRSQVAIGELRAPDLQIGLIAVAGLASAMLEALLRGTPIDRREAAFAALVDDSGGILTGSPKDVRLRSGII